MPRGKRGSPALRGGGRGNGGRRGQGQSYRAQFSARGLGLHADFTLAQEAQQTLGDDHRAWENATLRRMPIKFLSAGSINTEDYKNLSVDDPPAGPQSGQPSTTSTDDLDPSKDQEDIDVPSPAADAVRGESANRYDADTTHQAFFFDVQRRSSAHSNQIIATIPERRLSIEGASDSEEIIFQGRNKLKRTTPHQTISLATIHTELQVMEEQLPTAIKPKPRPKTAPADDFFGVESNDRRHKPRRALSDSEDDAIIADYIANLRENGEIITPQSQDDSDEQDSSSSDSDSGDPDEAIDRTSKEASKIDQEGSSSKDKTRRLRKKCLQDIAELDGLLSSSSETSDVEPDFQLEQDELIADFDFMDWERPSLRKKTKKGPKNLSQFQDLDSDLERKIQAAWNSDRLKKSERKKQREEQRALGMLGKRSQTGDLMMKYPMGISSQQVEEELKAFLLCNDESLTFPPMDNHARKIVHELASKFNLKSKSIGQGTQRRPTLYRKKGTLQYEEQRFEDILRRINRKYFARPGTHDRQKRGARNRAGDAAARVGDGEIVGAAAPELGVDNRGRAMLEKMGWSSGTALGAVDNKGILQPVTQTMKRSKAGLG